MESERRKHRKPIAFLKRYGRIIIGGGGVLVLIFCAVFADRLSDDHPMLLRAYAKAVEPGTTIESTGEYFRWGADDYGRDLFSMALHGAQTSLWMAVGVQMCILVVGVFIGLLCGYYRKVDLILMRVMEIIGAIPTLLLALCMTSVLGAGVGNMMFVLIFCGCPGPVRMTRAKVLTLRKQEFAEAEKAMGASDMRTLVLHIMPHCSSYLLIRATSGISGTVSQLSSLAYLGVGLPTDIPNWGGMISEMQGWMFTKPYMVIVPGLCISFTTFCFWMLGDGLRDVLDPKLR